MNKRLLLAPAIGVTGYLALGVVVSIFGPFEYVGYQSVIVSIYVAIIIFFFGSAFMLGSRVRLPRTAIWQKNQNQTRLTYFFRASLIIAVFLMTYELLNVALTGGINFNLAASATAYTQSYTDYVRNSGSYDTRFLVTSMGAFFLFVAQVLGLFYFKELDRTSRLAVIYLFVVTFLVYTLGDGKQKQFGDMLIYIGSALLAKTATTGTLNFRTLAIAVGVLLGGTYVLLTLLAFRYQAIGISLTELNSKLHPLIHYREDYWLEGFLGEAFAFPIVMFSGYLGQGYYGLSLALEQPFIWTSFAGSSYSVSVILNQFFGAYFWVNESYPYRVGDATGWGQSKWHSVFSWLASDLSFTGVVLFMGIIGFIYGRAWREILVYKNPFAVMVFTLINIGVVYAPANNQLMHSPGALSTTLGVFLVYFLFRRNFNAAPTVLQKRRFQLTL